MLFWAAVFFVTALISGIFGFSGIAVASIGIAQTLFFVFLILFALAILVRILGGKR